MLRRFHSLPALGLGVFMVLSAGSGAILSVQPVLDRAAVSAAQGLSVGEALQAATNARPGVQALSRAPSGAISAQVSDAAGRRLVTLDPATGAEAPAVQESAAMGWIRGFHRSLQLGEAGRAAMGLVAAAMAVLSLTGLALLVRAFGGWRLGQPVRATGAKGWHARLGRIALAGVALSSVTGLWMSAANFGLVPDDSRPPLAAVKLADGPAMAYDAMPALAAVALDDLRAVRLPTRPGGAIMLETAQGSSAIDPVSGQVLASVTPGIGARIWEWVYMLHTGEGLWWIAPLLGLGAALVPGLAVTGAVIWLSRRRAGRAVPDNVAMDRAGLVILTGSEGGTTRGFAASLHRALTAAGERVHLGDMNSIGPMPEARALIVLSATYGDGAAPQSATQFLGRLDGIAPLPVAVLGFGDSAFPAFCGHADSVAAELARRGWPQLMATGRIDRQSPAEFNAWGRALGTALGLEIAPEHRPDLPRRHRLTLVSRREYGQEVQAPSVILRFRMRPRWLGGPRFRAGDLLGVMAPGATAPRFYSLASSSADGFVEICVRKVAGGVCSSFLHGLEPGSAIPAFVRANRAVATPERPAVMIASGCGIGPMAGLLRQAGPGPERSLYFGLRDPASDFLYREELREWQEQGRLTHLTTAASRTERTYVQDRLRADATRLADQIRHGAQVLVCGSIAMGRAVKAELDAALVPVGLSVATLKREGRYVEDIY